MIWCVRAAPVVWFFFWCLVRREQKKNTFVDLSSRSGSDCIRSARSCSTTAEAPSDAAKSRFQGFGRMKKKTLKNERWDTFSFGSVSIWFLQKARIFTDFLHPAPRHPTPNSWKWLKSSALLLQIQSIDLFYIFIYLYIFVWLKGPKYAEVLLENGHFKDWTGFSPDFHLRVQTQFIIKNQLLFSCRFLCLMDVRVTSVILRSLEATYDTLMEEKSLCL